MRVLFDLTHPAHVHLFRHAIDDLSTNGAKTLVTSREKDVTVDLLNYYNIPHRVLSSKSKRMSGMLGEWSLRGIRLLQLTYSFKPDIIVSRFNPASAFVSTVVNCEFLLFDDTETKPAVLRSITYPCADRIYTPCSFYRNLGSKQRRYDGYHELAYLHPNRFNADPNVLRNLGISRDETLVFVRLVSWDAPHDIGQSGFDDVVAAIKQLEDAGATVLLSTEGDLPIGLESYEVTVPVQEVHDLLYYSDLFIGESATMAIESAVLGTPAIFISSISAGVIKELSERYGLVYQFDGPNKHTLGLEKALEILRMSDPSVWQQRRSKLLNDKIDTTSFLLQEIRNTVM